MYHVSIATLRRPSFQQPVSGLGSEKSSTTSVYILLVGAGQGIDQLERNQLHRREQEALKRSYEFQTSFHRWQCAFCGGKVLLKPLRKLALARTKDIKPTITCIFLGLLGHLFLFFVRMTSPGYRTWDIVESPPSRRVIEPSTCINSCGKWAQLLPPHRSLLQPLVSHKASFHIILDSK